VVTQLIRDIRSDRIGGLAAEIAFYGTLSIFPALIALGALLGSLDDVTGRGYAAEVQETILSYVEEVLSTENLTVNATKEAFETGESVVGIAIITAIWASSRGFNAVIGALDIAYKVAETRSWIGTRLTAIGLSLGTLIVGGFALAMIVVSPFFSVGGNIANRVGLGEEFIVLYGWVQPLVTYLVVMVWATVLYYVAPNHHTPLKWALPGAFLATTWWLAASLGFGYYIRIASQGGNAIYGLLGGGLTLLVLFWIMGLGLLIGAELNAALVHQFERVTPGSKLKMVGEEVRERLDRSREVPQIDVELGADETPGGKGGEPPAVTGPSPSPTESARSIAGDV